MKRIFKLLEAISGSLFRKSPPENICTHNDATRLCFDINQLVFSENLNDRIRNQFEAKINRILKIFLLKS